MSFQIKFMITTLFLLLITNLAYSQNQFGTLEAESGAGTGTVFPRSNASGSHTKLFSAGQSIKLNFVAPTSSFYSISLRYSNDNNPPPSETVKIRVDKQVIGEFQSADTGDLGFGWNVFANSPTFKTFMSAGSHSIELLAQGGDSHGIEADRLTIDLLINGKPAIYPPDKRINWQYGDLYAVMYRAFDDKEQAALHVYCSENGSFVLSMIVTQANMYNEMTSESCKVIFYVLDNQIQVNIHFDGKLYEIIADDLGFTDPIKRYFDPNE